MINYKNNKHSNSFKLLDEESTIKVNHQNEEEWENK